jgi:hypothetical protein
MLSIYDEWHVNKNDLLIWRRFWALCELRRKWKWADSFFKQADRVDGHIVEPEAFGSSADDSFMIWCMWIALLRSVHEGITETLDAANTRAADKVPVAQVLPPAPEQIQGFPAIPGGPFRDFRNAIFHCQWSPTLAKFDLDESTTKALETLHKEIGDRLEAEFRAVYPSFKTAYNAPDYWPLEPGGSEWSS